MAVGVGVGEVSGARISNSSEETVGCTAEGAGVADSLAGAEVTVAAGKAGLAEAVAAVGVGGVRSSVGAVVAVAVAAGVLTGFDVTVAAVVRAGVCAAVGVFVGGTGDGASLGATMMGSSFSSTGAGESVGFGVSVFGGSVISSSLFTTAVSVGIKDGDACSLVSGVEAGAAKPRTTIQPPASNTSIPAATIKTRRIFIPSVYPVDQN